MLKVLKRTESSELGSRHYFDRHSVETENGAVSISLPGDNVNKRRCLIFGVTVGWLDLSGQIIVRYILIRFRVIKRCQFCFAVVSCFCLVDYSAAFDTISPLILVRYPWLFSAGSSRTCHLAPFVLNVIATSFPSILPLVVFPT